MESDKVLQVLAALTRIRNRLEVRRRGEASEAVRLFRVVGRERAKGEASGRGGTRL